MIHCNNCKHNIALIKTVELVLITINCYGSDWVLDLCLYTLSSVNVAPT